MSLAISRDSWKKMRKLTEWYRTVHLLAESLDFLKPLLRLPLLVLKCLLEALLATDSLEAPSAETTTEAP